MNKRMMLTAAIAALIAASALAQPGPGAGKAWVPARNAGATA